MNGLLQDCIQKSIVAVVWAWMIRLLVGEWKPLLTAVLILVIIDFALGFLHALVKKHLSSPKMVEGALKVVVYLSLIILGAQLGVIVGELNWVRDAVAIYIALTEALSILEHAKNFGVKTPAWLWEHIKAKVEQNGRTHDPS